MAVFQFSLFDPQPSTELVAQIAKILNCDDSCLLDAIALAVENLTYLPKDKSYSINFSGGKDSHVLLGIYLLYLKLGYPKLDVDVCFADTNLEHHSMYRVIDEIKTWCELQSLKFITVVGDTSY